MRARLFAVALSITALTSTGCAHVLPTLGAVLSRIDIPTVIRCAQRPTMQERAICLGLQVGSAAVDEALLHAADLAEKAREAAGPAGADDMTDAQRQRLAVDLDAALRDLEAQIAAHDAGSL